MGWLETPPVPYEIVPGARGKRMVLHQAWADAFMHVCIQENVRELSLVTTSGWCGRDVEFLKAFPKGQILGLRLVGTLFDDGAVTCLDSLLDLALETSCRNIIDFSVFTRLQSCFLLWRRGAESLFKIAGLIDLKLMRYQSGDCTDVGQLRNLRSLSILGAPLHSLDGIARLEAMSNLRLALLTKLTSIEPLSWLTNLQDLDIVQCRKFRSLDPLSTLASLRLLSISEDGQITSLKPLRPLQGLRGLFFYGDTVIEDGDLSVIDELKSLEKLAFAQRRHYNRRWSDFPGLVR